MKIKMKVSCSGDSLQLIDGWTYEVNNTLSKEQALEFVKIGYAVVVEDDKKETKSEVKAEDAPKLLSKEANKAVKKTHTKKKAVSPEEPEVK